MTRDPCHSTGEDGSGASGKERARHEYFMRLALREAMKACDEGEVPAGCVIVDRPAECDRDGFSPLAGRKVLGRAANQTERLRDPTAHAEMIAITQAAAARGDWRLTDSVLYVTKEPCAMCAGAIVLARIPVVVYGISDPGRGGAVSVFNILRHPAMNHRCEVIGGILAEECRGLLQGFFRDRRAGRSDRPGRGGHNLAERDVRTGSDFPDPRG